MPRRRRPAAAPAASAPPAGQGPGKTPGRRSYEGATISRLTSDWITSSTSADAEINGSLVRLRNRSRQLVRDNPYARQALRAIATNVVGTGITMQAQVPMLRGGGRLDQTVNDTIERAWQDWGRASVCHTAGRLSFADISRQAIMAMAESGEAFIRLVPQAFGGGRVPLALEMIEADLLDEGKTTAPAADGSEWRMGVHVDAWGRPFEYAFLTRHPGDLQGNGRWQHRIIPADQILHLALLDRPGQTRGVTWFASAIKQLHHLAGYIEAELVRARASSSLMGFITSIDGELYGSEVYDEERVTSFEPGTFKYLPPGSDVKVPQLDAPDGQLEPFMRAMLRSVAASIGVSYEVVSRDFSQTNYSSSRLSLLEDRENWRTLQTYLIDHLHKPAFEAWLDAAVLSGALPLPNYQAMPDRYKAVRWFPRGWGWVDPEKEIRAYKEAVRCGFTTQAQIIAEQGGDLDELLRARQAEVEMAAEMGLVFDTNPGDDGGAVAAAPTPEPNAPAAEAAPAEPPAEPPADEQPPDPPVEAQSSAAANDPSRALSTLKEIPCWEDATGP